MVETDFIISASQLSDFNACERRWYYKWYRRLMAKEGGYSPASVGSFVHKWLEFYYMPENALDPQGEMEKYAEHWKVENPDMTESINRALILGTTMTKKYVEWAKENRMDSDLIVTSTEERLTVSLDDSTNFVLMMKLDIRGKRKTTGAPVILDHKTVDTIGQGEAHAKLDIQFRTFDLGVFLATGEKQDGVIINELRRVDSNDENSKPPYFGRYEVRYSMDEMRNHWMHIMLTAQKMAKISAALESGQPHMKVVVPMPSMNTCRNCDFRIPCTMSDENADEEGFIQQMYKVKKKR